MTNEEILKKAIEKAVWSGFNNGKFPDTFDENIGRIGYQEFIVFRHDFAKAFWGGEVCYKPNTTKDVGSYTIVEFEPPAWQRHLQQMVLEEDPIKYLEQFL